MSDRRAAATAGALVAAVVIILGFGSGIGAVLSRSGGQATASPAGGHDRGTVVQDSSSNPVTAAAAPGPRGAALTAARSSGSYPQPIAGDGVAAADSMAATSDATIASGPPASASTSTDAPSGDPTSGSGSGSATSACAGSSLAAAMVEPLWMHFTKAHLETSPGQQVQDALNVDNYVKIHTVLLEDMVAPAVDTVLASMTGVTPFWMHFKTAHLETSPGDQVASAANVDQYTKTHTVLIENVAAPTMHDVTDYGCP